MRAHLARHACRRYLGHGSYTALRRCLPSAAPYYNTIPIPHLIAPKEFRRSIFEIFKEAPPEVKKPEYEPGWPIVLSWQSRVADKLRPPSREQLVQAFGRLFYHKLEYGVPVNSTQAQQCYELFRYLMDGKDGEDGPGLTLVELQAARDALLIVPKDQDVEYHAKFSKDLYAEIRRQRELDRSFSTQLDEPTPEESLTQEGLEDQNVETDPADEDFRCYLLALTLYGESIGAGTLLHSHWKKLVEENRIYKGAKQLWIVLLQGLAKEGREEELLEQAKVAQEFGIQYRPHFQEVMTTFFAKRDRVDETKHWFERDNGKRWATANTYAHLIRFARRNKQEEWLEGPFRALIEFNPRKDHWDVIFEWAALCRGEGVEGVKHMIDVMIKYNPDQPQIRPNIDTINRLVAAAIRRKDHYLAERFVSLASELKLQPDAKTYILQMDYRIAANDLSGARAVYLELRKTDVLDDEDLPVINKYIQALCALTKPAHRAIYEILGDLEYRIVTLDPETVVAICMTLLKNDDQFEVIDTLSVHVFHYSSKQRELIREAFIKFILDKKNSTARVWDAYQLLKQFFVETPRARRLSVMDGFLDRKRPDMAAQVFAHMKAQNDHELRPTVDDYVHALEGLGRCPDNEALDTIYNLLKLDTNIQPCTKMLNALMIAFSACRRPRAALSFWDEISRSREGPSYASLEIVFAVCERIPFGDDVARKVWRNMERMELEIPRAVFNAYCGVIAAGGNLEELMGLIEGMNTSVGYGPDMMTLGIAHNALPGLTLQQEYQDWAASQFPTIWSELHAHGLQPGQAILNGTLLEVRRQYNIPRVLKA